MLLSVREYQKPDASRLRPEGLWDAYIRMQGVHEFYETSAETRPSRVAFASSPMETERSSSAIRTSMCWCSASRIRSSRGSCPPWVVHENPLREEQR